MSALNTGTLAPDFTLPLVKGGEFSLRDALKRGPVIVAFFKITCPVCQFTFPYLERIYRSYPQGQYTLLGISQDEDNYTEEFAREYGITFPLALDDVDTYLVSNAYGITNVPTIFMISPDGGVQLSLVGWDRRDMEKLNREVARVSAATHNPLLQPGEKIPDSKAG
jgi:peroxiredoxin